MANVTTNNTIPYIPSELLGLLERVEALENQLKDNRINNIESKVNNIEQLEMGTWVDGHWDYSTKNTSYTFNNMSKIKGIVVIAAHFSTVAGAYSSAGTFVEMTGFAGTNIEDQWSTLRLDRGTSGSSGQRRFKFSGNKVYSEHVSTGYGVDFAYVIAFGVKKVENSD